MIKLKANLWKDIYPFNTLTDEEREEVLSKLQFASYEPGTYIFRQGDSSLNVLFLIEKGLAEVIVSGDNIQETAVSYRKAGDFFGETNFLVGNEYSGSVRVLEELDCWLFPKNAFEELLNKKPVFANYFTQIITERMRSLYEEIGREQAQSAYHAEASTFQRKIAEIMSSPVLTCNPDETVEQIAKRLAGANVSTLVMVDHNKPLGLVTESHLVARVLAKNQSGQKTTAEMVAEPFSTYLSPDAYFYQALLTMVRHRMKHLPIVDDGKLVGIVTVSDLIKTRSIGTISILQDIEERNTIPELAAAVAPLNNVLRALLAENTPVKEITAIMNEYYDRLTRKIISIAEEELKADGFGLPPTEYCFINMGSGGRREQSLRTDLDNAIIFSESPNLTNEQLRSYFLELGRRVIEGLVLCGFQRCPGDVMASNPIWCRSLDEWINTAETWITKPDGVNVRNLTIFLDFRALAGKESLVFVLRERIFDVFAKCPVASHLLAADELQYRQPLNILGRFVTNRDGPHKGEMNLKASACVRIVDCVRLFALRHRIPETSTWDRLDRLEIMNILKKEDVEFFQAAYETIMFFRLRENIRKSIMGKEADNYLNPVNLTRMERALLKDALIAIGKLQKLTDNHFSMFWLPR